MLMSANILQQMESTEDPVLLTRERPWMVKKFISEWNLSPEKHAKLLSINQFDAGTFAMLCVCLTQRRSCLITDTEEQNKQEDPTLYPEKGQTHSPSFPYLRRSVAVGANRCDLAIPEPAPISPRVK
jgi:hypothetical protein